LKKAAAVACANACLLYATRGFFASSQKRRGVIATLSVKVAIDNEDFLRPSLRQPGRSAEFLQRCKNDDALTPRDA